MNFIAKIRSTVGSYFSNPSKEVEKTEVGIFEIYLEYILKILHWQNVKLTLQVFLLFNHLFWFIFLCHLKFYGVLSLFCLVTFVLDTWYRNTVYAEYKGEYTSVIKAIKHNMFRITDSLRTLRKDSPFMFASTMVLMFLTLRIISSSTSGYTFSYVLFLLLFFIPLGVKMLPVEIAEKVKQLISSPGTPKCILAEDELIPFILGKDFTRRDADLDSLLTDRTADSVTNSLVSGITTMPSYLEVTENPNDIEEEDFLPGTTTQGVVHTPGELSSDSDSDNREIRFDSDHFNTSSSEDDPYSKGLTFAKDPKEVPSDSQGIRGMINSVMTSAGGHFIANMFQSATVQKTDIEKAVSESDSDFEIVNSDEFSN